MEQTMNSASELYEQFMQKSEQVLEMPAKFAQLAENATKLSAKIGQAVKSFAHFNEELKSLVDYFNHCEGTENEFCRDIMIVHQKFCLLQEEAKRLSERLVATFADPVISDQKVYTAHVKHMVTICSGVYVMNYNVKKNTKKISCLKKKPLKWKAEVFRYKRLLKPARMTTSIDDVCKNKYELFFLKALRDLTEDQIRQASLFLERLRAAAVVQSPTEEVNVEAKYKKDIQPMEKYPARAREPNDHAKSDLSGKSKAAVEKTKSRTIVEKQTSAQDGVISCAYTNHLSSVVSIFEPANKTALSCTLEQTKKSGSSSSGEGRMCELARNNSNAPSDRTVATSSSHSASTKAFCEVNGRQNKIQVVESKMSKLLSLTKQKLGSEAKAKKPSYRKSTIASSKKVSLRYEDRIRQECQPAVANTKRSCTSTPLKKVIELGNIQSSKTAYFVSKIPRSRNAIKQSVNDHNSSSDTSVHRRKTAANSKPSCVRAFSRKEALKEEKVSLIQKTDCRLNTLSSTITPKDALKVSLERSDFMRWKKGDNGKRVVVIIDQSMETKRKETADVAINVSLESA